MHTTAIRFALRYSFRLGSDRLGYYLTDGKGAIVDRPFWGEHTAAAGIRMMRRNLRHKVAQTRAA